MMSGTRCTDSIQEESVYPMKNEISIEEMTVRTVSYVEIEITESKVNVFERLDSDETDKLVEAVAKYGLKLEKTFRSICG